jgi:hypothetical protein
MAETFLPIDMVTDLLDGEVAEKGFSATVGATVAEKPKMDFDSTIPDEADLTLVGEFLEVCVKENPGYTLDKVKAEATASPYENANFWKAYKSWVKSQAQVMRSEEKEGITNQEVQAQMRAEQHKPVEQTEGKQEKEPPNPSGHGFLAVEPDPAGEKGTGPEPEPKTKWADDRPKKKKREPWATKNTLGDDAVTCKARANKLMAPVICESCGPQCDEYAKYLKWRKNGE